jgi:hypothetical protein
VLLGSVATGKYVDVLAAHLGPRLHYPISFLGRGDMSRGGLLLRSARAAVELEYAVLDPAVPRRGKRPPKLERADRTQGASPRRVRLSPDQRRGGGGGAPRQRPPKPPPPPPPPHHKKTKQPAPTYSPPKPQAPSPKPN